MRLLAGPEMSISSAKVRDSRLVLLYKCNREPQKACEWGSYRVSSGVSTSLF